MYIINKQKTIRDSHIWHTSKTPLLFAEQVQHFILVKLRLIFDAT